MVEKYDVYSISMYQVTVLILSTRELSDDTVVVGTRHRLLTELELEPRR